MCAAAVSRTGREAGDIEIRLRADGFGRVAGVDEAGRGPLAGPVVAAAVILPSGWKDPGVDDSKRLSAKRREELSAVLRSGDVIYAIAMAQPEEIDRINIHHASLLAMRRAVEQLSSSPDFLLIDGRFTIDFDLPQKAVVGGDAACRCIAAASILAKVERDRLMLRMHQQWPQYNFASNKGYPTAEHKRALEKHGPCPIHRRSYGTVAQMGLAWGEG